jgi:uncharacterized DUF497 family protein
VSDVHFEWDARKAEGNRRKHGISFEEAVTVFYDDNALLLSDPDHSYDEERFLLMGFSERSRILVVSHSFREAEQVIRIISARKATTSERKQYYER